MSQSSTPGWGQRLVCWMADSVACDIKFRWKGDEYVAGKFYIAIPLRGSREFTLS